MGATGSLQLAPSWLGSTDWAGAADADVEGVRHREAGLGRLFRVTFVCDRSRGHLEEVEALAGSNRSADYHCFWPGGSGVLRLSWGPELWDGAE